MTGKKNGRTAEPLNAECRSELDMSEDAFIDFTLEEKDLRGLGYLLGMGLVAFKRVDAGPKREAVRVGAKLLKMLSPVVREIKAEQASWSGR
jgi:hypothetical protein